MKYIILLVVSISSLLANKFYYEFDKKVELAEVKQSKSLNNTLQYKSADGKTIKFKNEIIVKCKKDIICEDDFNSLNIENYKQLSKNFFLIYVQEEQDIFQLSQELYKKESIKLAHPNFIKDRVLR